VYHESVNISILWEWIGLQFFSWDDLYFPEDSAFYPMVGSNLRCCKCGGTSYYL